MMCLSTHFSQNHHQLIYNNYLNNLLDLNTTAQPLLPMCISDLSVHDPVTTVSLSLIL